MQQVVFSQSGREEGQEFGIKPLARRGRTSEANKSISDAAKLRHGTPLFGSDPRFQAIESPTCEKMCREDLCLGDHAGKSWSKNEPTVGADFALK